MWPNERKQANPLFGGYILSKNKIIPTPIFDRAIAKFGLVSIKDVVGAYIAHGHKYGFASAECVLNMFTPSDVIEGLCYHVPQEKRLEFLKRLQKGSAFKNMKGRPHETQANVRSNARKARSR